MKSIIISVLSLGTFGLLSSCTFVEDRESAPYTTRTTTSEVAPTTYGTVETRTTQTY